MNEPDIAPISVQPVDSVVWRTLSRVEGRVHAIRIQPWHGIATVEMDVFDETGGLTVIFTGRRQMPGIRLGVTMQVWGRVGARNARLCMFNPNYRLVA